jgi:2'-5' RNA ligase
MKLRLFIALPLTPGLLKKIAFLEDKINKKLGFKLDWIPLKNLHLTILFLGYFDYENYSKLIEVFDSSQLTQPFNLKISKLDYGPPGTKRMIWLYIEKNNYLKEVKKNLEDKLNELRINYRREERELLPHINLLRFKKERNLMSIEEDLNWQISLNEIAIFQSRLLPQGAEYEKLRSKKI